MNITRQISNVLKPTELRNSSTWWKKSLRQIKVMPSHIGLQCLQSRPERTNLWVPACSLMDCPNHTMTLNLSRSKKRRMPLRRQKRSEIVHCLDNNYFYKLIICIINNCTYNEIQCIM